MKNPNKRKFNKIAGGAIITNESKDIKMPPETAIIMNPNAIILNGEMNIALLDHIGIKENGKVKARLDNKYPKILVSNKLDEKSSIDAVKKYMEEKGITSIKDIIGGQELAKDGTSKRKETSTMGIGE